MMIAFKPDVRFHRTCLEPFMIEGLQVLLQSAPPTRGNVLVVTSACDSEHSANSLHYEGKAFDIRLRDPYDRIGEPVDLDSIPEWVDRLAELLPEWDILDEGNHLHMEYDPK